MMDAEEYAILDTETGRLLPHRFVVLEKATAFLEKDDSGRFVLVFKPNQWQIA
jgi:hypothetical protein